MGRASGFSLIELMVTLAVLAVLAAAGTPFARSWMDSNRQLQARNLMWEGISQARAIALRNPAEVKVAGQAAAKLQRSDNLLQVVSADGDEVLWKSASLPGGATSKFNLATAAGAADSNDWSCVAFDNRGHRVTTGVACAIAAEKSRIAVGFNGQDLLYVDLL